MSNGISVVIPVHNEENSIRDTAINISMQLEKITNSFEIVVVDDGSNDGTAEELKKINSQNIKIITHLKNRGYGAALKTGIRNAQHECVVITDADGTYPNERIPELIKTFQEGDYDMVVGARVGSKVKIPLIRKPAKWFITKLASCLSGTKIPDLNSGLRAMKKEVPLESYIEANRLNRKYKIETINSVMLGLPGDTHKSIKETVDFLCKSRDIQHATYGIAIPYPGTEMYRMAQKNQHGLKLTSNNFSDYQRYNSAVMEVNEIKPAELIKLQKRGLIRIYSCWWRIWPMLRRHGLKSLVAPLWDALSSVLQSALPHFFGKNSQKST